MGLPTYISHKTPSDVIPQLQVVLKGLSLQLHKSGSPRNQMDGIEQDWKCCDDCGDLFFFSICQVTEKNVIGLPAGGFYFSMGPSARGRKPSDCSAAFKQFQRELILLGIQRYKKSNGRE